MYSRRLRSHQATHGKRRSARIQGNAPASSPAPSQAMIAVSSPAMKHAAKAIILAFDKPCRSSLKEEYKSPSDGDHTTFEALDTKKSSPKTKPETKECTPSPPSTDTPSLSNSPPSTDTPSHKPCRSMSKEECKSPSDGDHTTFESSTKTKPEILHFYRSTKKVSFLYYCYCLTVHTRFEILTANLLFF